VKRINLSIGLGVFLSLLFTFIVVSFFHSLAIPNSVPIFVLNSLLAVIVMNVIWIPIHWAFVFKYSTAARNKRLDALDEKLNRLLEQQER